MNHPDPSHHQSIEELLENYDEIIARSSDEDLGRVAKQCFSQCVDMSKSTEEPLENLLECLELLELDRRTHLASSVRSSSEQAGSTGSDELSIARFRVERRLGHGGFGVVYLAQDPILGRKVAIKIPRPEIMASEALRARFVKESQVVAKLSHPGIIPIHEAGESGAISFQVMEYCAGGSLSEYLRNLQRSDDVRSPLPQDEAIDLIVSVGEAVEHAHRHGILHRDLKPSNILLQGLTPDARNGDKPWESNLVSGDGLLRQYRPVVSDFGLATLLADATEIIDSEDSVTLSRDQTLMAGTPNYMAPEQFEARSNPASAATDVFGLGVILFELLAGRSMFFRPDGAANTTLSGHVTPTLRTSRQLEEELPHLEKDLAAIIRMATAKKQSERYQTVEQFVNDLRAFRRGEPISARSWSQREHVYRWVLRRPSLASLLLVCGLLVICLFSFGVWHLTQLSQLNRQLERTADEKQRQAEAALAASQRADSEAAFANRQQELAEEQTWIAREREYAAEMMQASHAWKTNDVHRMNEHLQRIRRNSEDRFEWQYLHGHGAALKSFIGHRDTIVAAGLDPQTSILYSASRDGTIREWNTDTQELINSVDFGQNAVRYMGHISRNCSIAAIRRSLVDESEDEVIVWHLKHRKEIIRRRYGVHDVCCLSISDDGAVVAVGGRRQPTKGDFLPFLELWYVDQETGGLVPAVDEPFRVAVPPCHAIYGSAFIRDTHELAVVALLNGPDQWDYQPGRLNCDSVRETPADGAPQQPPGIALVGERRKGRAIQLKVSNDGLRMALLLDETSNQIDVLKWPSGVLEISRNFGDRIPMSIGFPHQEGLLALGLSTVASSVSKSSTMATATVGSNHAESFMLWDLEEDKISELPYEATRGIETIIGPQDSTSRSWILGEVGGRLNIWSPEGMQSDRTLSGHRPLEAWALAYSPDSQFIYSAGDDHRIRKFASESGQELCKSVAREQLLSCLAVSPDGRILAAGGYDDIVTIYETQSLRVVANLTGHTHDIRAVAFSCDGQYLATAGRDHLVRVWNVAEARCVQQLASHQNTIRSLIWTKGGELISADGDGVVNLWNANGTLQTTHLEHEGVLTIAIAPAGTKLPVGDYGGTQRLTSTLRDRVTPNSSVEPVATISNSGEQQMQLLTVGQDELIAFGMNSGSLRMFHLPTGQRWSLERQSNVEMRSLAFSHDGQTLACGCSDGSIRFWQTSTQREVLRVDNSSAVHQICYSPHSRSLAAALHDGSIRILDSQPETWTGQKGVFMSK